MKYVWAGIVLIMLFLVQTYAFTPAKNNRKRASSEKIHFTSNRLYHDISISRDGDILIGSVRITHDGMVLTCDSAVVYENSNSFLAYGHVHMVQGDSLSLKGDSLYYDGSQEFAQVFDHVIMKHGSMTLYTDILNYDRIDGRGFYDVGGKIVDGKTVLTSQDGEYFTGDKTSNFRFDVLLLNNGKDSLLTDTLHYDTQSKWAHATGPSNILSDGSRIYTENGYYNTDTGKARLYDRPQFFNNGRQLVGDSIVYVKETELSEAFGNIYFYDPNNKSILLGDYGWYNDSTGEAMCTENAIAKDFSNVNDTLYIHGDTLRLQTFYHKTDSAYRVLRGFYHVRAFRSDMQMVCDSLSFISKDSCMTLYKDPILWSDSRQILGEVVSVYTNDSIIDSVYVDQQALLIEQLCDTTLYNQVGGSLMRAYFDEGSLKEFWVDGNGTAVNYPMEEDSTFLYMNYIEASKLRAYLEDEKLKRMKAFPSPKGTTYPLAMAPPERTKLPGFAWFEWIRPKDKDDIFEWKSKNEANKLKAQPRRNAPMQTIQRFANKASDAINKEQDSEIAAELDETIDTVQETVESNEEISKSQDEHTAIDTDIPTEEVNAQEDTTIE